MLEERSKVWSVAVLACLAAATVAALTLRESFALIALSDVLQCVLLCCSAMAFVPLALHSEGRMRLFWSLIAFGLVLWFSYQLLWTYFEVVQRRQVPEQYWADIILFLHLVPLMAAIGVRPHVARDEYAARAGRLDFALLIVWWIYLYVLSVLPWQYAQPNIPFYTHNINALYLAEKLVLLTALAGSVIATRGRWRRFYAHLFGATLLYSISSYIANWALARHAYHSGSLYDVPLAASMAWPALIALWTHVEEPRPAAWEVPSTHGIWVARAGMIATLSLPLFAAWALLDRTMPAQVRSFRLIATLAAALVMGIMAFVRQRLLDRHLLGVLGQSRESLENLKRLQAQVIQSEKLASIGQLVGGAAHELNNPITAMLGYSELLMNTPMSPEQHKLAARIGQQVRRTRSLVAGLLSFARQKPVSKSLIDVNTLLRTAVKLTEPQSQALKMEVRLELSSDLPKVLGDSNQLLQVCLQIVANALHQMEERGGRSLMLRTRQQDDYAVIEVVQGAPTSDHQGAPDTPPSDVSLGLSACRGIVQEHLGRIECERREDGSTTVRIELPASPLPDARATMSPTLLAESPPSA